MSLKKIIETIRKNNNFLITAHVNVEGDALGSELAFLRLLKKLGKRARIMNDDVIPEVYAFLPGVKDILRLDKRSAQAPFDCLAVLDCADISRAGGVARLDFSKKTVCNIDHHISNTFFADVNWVEPQASSCSEMVYALYKAMRVPFDEFSATNLYVGIMTDTGSFRYSNTAVSTHRAVAELMNYKLNIAQLYQSVYESIPFDDMKILMEILPTMKRACAGRVVYFELPRGVLAKNKVSFDLSEQLLSFARSVKDADVAVIFKENFKHDPEVRVNLRSRGAVNVNNIAKVFNGGGHKTASGCTVKGSLSSARKNVLSEVQKALR